MGFLCSFTQTSVMFMFLFLIRSALSLQTIVVEEQSNNLQTLQLPSAVGPESIAFDPSGAGPYTGVSDGSVLRWDGRQWIQFAVPPRNASSTVCNGTKDPTKESTCGRPLGLQFHKPSGSLYIADAYHGLLVVGPDGGLATTVATEADGVPFKMTNGIDIDQETGAVYFTDSSTQYSRNQHKLIVLTEDKTGRFMRYDPQTNQVQVLFRGLMFPNGVSMSSDNTFVLVAELTKMRILRYWIKGQKAGTSELFATTSGFPDNIKRNSNGEFWAGINPGISGIHNATPWGKTNIAGMRFDVGGALIGVLDDRREGYPLSEVEERNGTFYLGSVEAPYVSIFNLLSSDVGSSAVAVLTWPLCTSYFAWKSINT